MSTKVIERPPQFCFSKNEIRYVFNSTDTSANGFFIRVQLWWVKSATTNILLKTMTRVPNSDGSTYIYINDILNSLLIYAIPDPAVLQSPALSQLAQFYVCFAEGNSVITSPVMITTENVHIRTAFKGGIERKMYSRDNYLSAYFDAQKPWLSWQPDYRFIQADETVFLTAFIKDNNLVGKRLRITATDLVGRQYIKDITAFTSDGNYLYHFNISPQYLDIVAMTTNQVVSYSVTLQNITNSTAVLNARTFYIDYRPAYSFHDLLYINSLGGVDTIRVRGDTTKSLTKNVNQVAPGLDIIDSSATIKTGDISIYSIQRADTFKGDIGFVEDEVAQDALIDLLMSSEIYMRIANRWVPVINIQTSSDLRAASDKKYSFAVEWQIAIQEEVFTPELTLGISPDTETYL